MLGILIQIIAVILGLIGFVAKISILFLIGGFLSLFLDVIGFLSGKMNPIFPIILYIGGYIVVGSWHGILVGALVGQILEVVFMFIVIPLGSGTYLTISKINNWFRSKK